MKIINKFLQEARSFEKKDSVKAVIQCPKGCILILRRQNDEAGGGMWDIPGGAIEKGESQTDALKREVFEETGLTIDGIRKIKTVTLKIPETGVNSSMNVYSAKTEDIDVKLKPATWKGSDGKPEHTEYKWIGDKVDLENLPMIDQLKKILLSRLS
jgi:8-oxo-dGTP diphosphatase